MKEENGRLEEADEKEVAYIKDKIFKCKKCGEIRKKKKKVFGEEIRCRKCMEKMFLLEI